MNITTLRVTETQFLHNLNPAFCMQDRNCNLQNPGLGLKLAIKIYCKLACNIFCENYRQACASDFMAMPMTDAERKIALKRLGASTIKPGWPAQDLVTWSPHSTKPSVQNLRAEVLRRASSTGKDEPRCGNWLGFQLRATTPQWSQLARWSRCCPTSSRWGSPARRSRYRATTQRRISVGLWSRYCATV